MRNSEFWYCNVCGAQNHEEDGECQYCSCEGAECMRDSCSDDAHFCECGEPASHKHACWARNRMMSERDALDIWKAQNG
jgi:hypothetical protein